MVASGSDFSGSETEFGLQAAATKQSAAIRYADRRRTYLTPRRSWRSAGETETTITR